MVDPRLRINDCGCVAVLYIVENCCQMSLMQPKSQPHYSCGDSKMLRSQPRLWQLTFFFKLLLASACLVEPITRYWFNRTIKFPKQK